MRNIWYLQNDPDLSDEINLDDNNLPQPGTIAGEDFCRLMDLCFAQADVFSLTKVHGPYRTDARLERALQKFQFKHLSVDHWFCYAPSGYLHKVTLYHASRKAKETLLRYADNLFLKTGDNQSLCSLEDLCFFRDQELFFGTLSHEFMCYAHVLSPEFGAQLKTLGTWEEEETQNSLASLNLDDFAHRREVEIRGRVELPMWTTAGEFCEQFFELIDANRWSFRGDLMELVDGRPAQPDEMRDTAAGKENN